MLLMSLDAVLELVSDVTDIDALHYAPDDPGFTKIQLWCSTEFYREVLMTQQDFEQVKTILTSTLSIKILDPSDSLS